MPNNPQHDKDQKQNNAQKPDQSQKPGQSQGQRPGQGGNPMPQHKPDDTRATPVDDKHGGSQKRDTQR